MTSESTSDAPAAAGFSSLALPWAPLLIFAAAAIPAVGALAGPFYWIDDHAMIHENPVATGPFSIVKIFTEPHFAHYGPFHELLIWIQWHLFGDNAAGFRIVSILLQAGAAWMCFAMLRNLTRRPLLALGIAMLWAMHPIQSESVAWITEQKTLWCGLFCFASLAVYFDARRTRGQRIGLGLLLMLLGCFGKSPGLVVGPIVLLYEICGLSPRSDSAKSENRLSGVLSAIPFLLVSAVFAKLALWANAYSEGIAHWTIGDTIINLPGTLLIYFRAAFAPWTASFFEEMDRVLSFRSPAFWGKLVALLYVYIAGCIAVRAGYRRLFVFCALAWVLALGPMLNVSLWTFPAYDRFEYLALPFLLLGAALILEGVLSLFQSRQTEPAIGAVAPAKEKSFAAPLLWSAVLAIVAVTGFRRGLVYSNEVTLMLDATEKAPGNAYANAQLAYALYPEWVHARQLHQLPEQQALAHTIAAAARKAESCWNFTEFFVTPAPLLVMTGEVLHDTGFNDEAIPFLEDAIKEPRWSRFTDARQGAKRTLSIIALDFAQSRVMQAASPGTPPAIAQELAKLALTDVQHSNELMHQTSDSGYWWEYRAHEILALYYRQQSNPEDCESEFRAAEKALQQIEPRSQLHAKAIMALESLKKQR